MSMCVHKICAGVCVAHMYDYCMCVCELHVCVAIPHCVCVLHVCRCTACVYVYCMCARILHVCMYTACVYV